MTCARGLFMTCACLLLCAAPSSAQTAVGVRGGVQMATLDTQGEEGGESADWGVRATFGGFLTWRAWAWLELQPEVVYSQKGAKTEEFGIAARALLDYLEVPVLARYTRGAGARRYYVAGGPAIGVLLRARTRADFGGAIEEIDIKEDVETLDWSVIAGGGAEFGSIVVDARYIHGLGDIDADTSDEQRIRNRAVSLTVGFRF